MNLLEHEKHKLWEGRGVDRLILPKIPNSHSPKSSPRLARRNTSNDVLMRGTLNNDVTLRGTLNHDVTLKVPNHDTNSSSGLVSSTSGSLVQELNNDVTLEVPQLVRSDFGGIIPEISYGSSAPAYSDEPYDSDDDLRVSMTLPRYRKLQNIAIFLYVFLHSECTYVFCIVSFCTCVCLPVCLRVSPYHTVTLNTDISQIKNHNYTIKHSCSVTKLVDLKPKRIKS